MPPYEPTQKEIRRACEEIQTTWSPREKKRREGGTYQYTWEPQTIRWRDIPDNNSDNNYNSPASRADE